MVFTFIFALLLSVLIIPAPVVAGQPQQAQNPLDNVAELVHLVSMIWFGFASLLLIVVLLLNGRRNVHYCPALGAVGIVLWIVGAFYEMPLFLLLGVIALSLAHILSCSIHYYRDWGALRRQTERNDKAAH